MPQTTRTPIVDDDGSGTTGTILNNAWKQELYGQIDGRAVHFGFGSTGLMNNFIPSVAGRHTLIEWYAGSDLTITGVSGGVAGDTLTLKNTGGGGNLLLPHQDGRSVAVNRFHNAAASAPTPLAAHGFAHYFHNGQFWLMQGHDQGAWITPPFNAANFYGNGSMTWTVDAGDIVALSYKLTVRSLTVGFYLTSTTVGGTLNNILQINNGAWGGFTSVRNSYALMAYFLDALTPGTGFIEVGASSNVLALYKQTTTNFTASTNGTYVSGTVTFEVN